MLQLLKPLLPVALALMPLAEAQDQPEFMIAEGEHLHVLCWFYSERTGQALPDALLLSGQEVMAQGRALFGGSADAGAAPFQLFIYTTRKGASGYIAGAESVSPGSSPGTVDLAHWASRTVHVRMRPYPGDRPLVELSVPVDCLRRASAGIAHLVRQDLAGGEDNAPRWFAAGAAQYLATRALAGRGLDGLGDESIWLGTRVFAVRRMIAGGSLPVLEDVLADSVDELEESAVESLHAVLFEFLMEQLADRGEAWGQLRTRLARGLRGPALLPVLEEWLGEGGIGGLEAHFHRWLQQRRPAWDDVQPALQRHPEGWAQAPLQGNAIAWRSGTVPEPPYRIRGEFRTFLDVRTGTAQANVLFGRLGADFLQVSIHSDTGVSVWDRSHEKDNFEMLQSKGWSTPFQLRDWQHFEIRVLGEDAYVSVANERLSPFSILGRDMGGAWAVGSFKGSVTLWRSLSIEPIRD
ncbi:MAG TPA: hypothetical protein EYQ74_06845 [Planctomycetes bacterium]|nr:hypothetical protein [Planctomycetota bacterium]HIK59520.1 hypothetical protein [Planctomycetota bacterium]